MQAQDTNSSALAMYSRGTYSLTNNSVAGNMSNFDSRTVTRLRLHINQTLEIGHVGPINQMRLFLLFGLAQTGTVPHDVGVVCTLTLSHNFKRINKSKVTLLLNSYKECTGPTRPIYIQFPHSSLTHQRTRKSAPKEQ